MELFNLGFVLAISLCLDLGIVNLAIIKSAVDKGFRPALNIGLGSTLGDLIYASMALYGITLLLNFTAVRWILWIFGTLVLLFFCFKTLSQSFTKPNITEGGPMFTGNESSGRYFLYGTGLALSSPTAIIWFMTVGGGLIAAQSVHSRSAIFYFLSGFGLASVIWSFGLAFVSYKGGRLMGRRFKQIFSLISAAIFLILAALIFIDGYKTLL
ncbi:MAG: LysE family transporter [Candidatus Neomarinimicrobiota bacterium]